MPFILSIALFFIPESPRWLILTNRFEEGTKSLKWLRPVNAAVDAEANEIRNAIEKEREISKGVRVMDLFSNPVDRRRTILSVCAVSLQAASGSMFIIGEFFRLDVIQHTDNNPQPTKPTSLAWPRSAIPSP